MEPSPHRRIKLSEAAVDLGCHVETLRERIRAGLLEATRGPHGAYYVSAEALEEMPPLYRQPPTRRFGRGELEDTWSKAEQLAGYSAQTREAELQLLRALRADPSRNPRLYRLVSVQRLEASGLSVHLRSRTDQRLIDRFAKTFLAQLEPVFPGITGHWNGRATLDVPLANPFALGSYSYWKVGQYTQFGGYEKARQPDPVTGKCHFAGEHCSINFQGFMEGGAEEGARAANEILADYKADIFP